MNAAQTALFLLGFALWVIPFAGCVPREGSHPPVLIDCPGAMARMNNVSLLDRSISRKIGVQSSGAERTETGTLRVWSQLRNRTDHPLQIEARVKFYNERQVPVEGPSEWRRLHLHPKAILTYTEFSTSVNGLAYYHIEVREGR